MSGYGKLLLLALLASLLRVPASYAAEFEVLDRLSVDGYTVLRGSADIPGGGFSVGGSTLMVKAGNVGIGTAGPFSILDVRGKVLLGGYDSNPVISGGQLEVRAPGGTETRQDIWQAGQGLMSLGLKAGGSSVYITNNYTGTDFGAAGKSITINTSGNIGIGTTAPAAQLHLANSIAAQGTGEASGFGQLRLENGVTALSNAGGIEFKIAGDSNGYGSKIQALNSSGSQLVFAGRNASATWVEYMRIASGGNIGIGTTGPTGKLHVQDDSSGGVNSYLRNLNAGSGAYTSFQIGNDAAQNKLVIFTNSSARTADGGAGNTTLRTDSGLLHLGAGGGQKVTIDTAGNVGIGTTGPDGKLQVAGAFSNFGVGVQDGNDRPSIAMTGSYPQFILMSGVGNANHGPTISLAAYDSGSSGAFKSWTLGTAGNNATFLDIGYGTSGNPHVNGIRGYGTTVMTLLNSGYVGIGVLAPSHILQINGIGRSSQASWATTSDRRVKTNIQPLGEGLDTIMKLNPVSFEYIETYRRGKNGMEGLKRGFIAQEIEKIVPETVSVVNEKFGEQEIKDFRLLNTGDLTPILVKSVQELNNNTVKTGPDGSVGIGTASPKTKLQVSGQIYQDSAGTKMLFKSPDGTCSACGPNDSDVWTCLSAACP